MSLCLNPDCLHQNVNEENICQCCGSKLRLREHYRAIKLIGEGGFAKTFLAVDEDKPSKPDCAIKQFLPQAQGTDTLEKASELFQQEAVRLEQLDQHPQIPSLLAYFTHENRQYLVQQFIDGENLAAELTQKGAFNEAQIISLLEELLPVLEFVHSHQVIHRDIKPENIIRHNSEGKLFLVDFGASKYATKTQLAARGTVIGSLGYAAPEQEVGKANFSSDIYGLGVTCIHLLTNVNPVELWDVSENKWVWHKYLTSAINKELERILDKMVARATSKRYQSVAEVLQDLNTLETKQKLTATKIISTRPELQTQISPSPGRKLPLRPLGIGIAVFSFTVVGLGLYAIYEQWQQKRDLVANTLDTMESLKKAGNYQECIEKAQANPSSQVQSLLRDCENAQADLDLTAAKELAIDFQFSEAITKLKQIPSTSLAFAEASQLLPVYEAKQKYSKLRNHLAAGEWKAADRETKNVMLEVAGRKKSDWMDDESLKNFSCTELRTIDDLWRQYSNGRFGFRVQRDIYLSLGGSREYNRKVWETFAQSVGWRVGTKWLSYQELTFDISTAASKGHLPYDGLGFGISGFSDDLFSSLMFRCVECNL